MRSLSYLLLSYCILHTPSLLGQTAYQTDSATAMHYFTVFQKYEYLDSSKARIYSDSALYFAKKTKNSDLMGRAHQFKGWYYQDCSKFKESNKEFYRSLAYLKKAGSRQGVADAYGNLGNSYLDMNEYQKSLDYQLLSLSENEKIIADHPSEEELRWANEGRTYALHNIAAIYQDISLYEKALEYEYKSVAYELEADNPVGVAISYNTLATIHKSMNNRDSAEFYFLKAMDLYSKNPYPFGLASTLHSYALLEGSSLSKNERDKMMRESLELRKGMGDIDGEMKILIDIGEYQFDELSVDSLSNLLEHVYYNIEEHDLDILLEGYFRLYARYSSRIGKYDSAYFALENFLELKAISDEKKRTHDLIAQDIRFQLETKNFNDSLRLESNFSAERLQTQEQLNVKQNYIYLSVIGLIIVLVSLGFIIQSNRRRKRLNEVLSEKNSLIQEQKSIVEERNQSISDSINYAKRLQTAILPTSAFVNIYLPESFLLYRPKDIVSGDFHWFEVKDDRCYIAAADCTGHGVPGAMVSVVCNNALNRSVNEYGLREPKEILDKTRELVIEHFAKSAEDVVDGMDISLCAIDLDKKTLWFAGANNPLWIVRKGELNGASASHSEGNLHLIEYKGDKQPVGQYAQMKSFTQQEIALLADDTIYLFTDGYADQFGGPAGKKFKYGPFKRELISINASSMEAQRSHLERVFEEWKGSLEQVDDVCVIGFKPLG